LITEVRSAIWIQVMGDNIVMFLASYEDPQVAKQLVDATIESYIQWQINADREESVVAQIFFADLIDAYDVRPGGGAGPDERVSGKQSRPSARFATGIRGNGNRAAAKRDQSGGEPLNQHAK
jgi:hypothetical protein